MKLTQEEITINGLKKNPIIYRKISKHGTTIYAETIYGSFVDLKEDGMCQQKNAMSRKELIKYGYKRVDNN